MKCACSSIHLYLSQFLFVGFFFLFSYENEPYHCYLTQFHRSFPINKSVVGYYEENSS